MKSRFRNLLAVALALAAASALSATDQGNIVLGNPLKDPGNLDRVLLTYKELFSSSKPATPVSDAAFGIPANAAAPAQSFEGRLQFADAGHNGTFEKLRDDFDYLGADKADWKHLPKFSFEFIQSGSYLIPVQQGLAITGHSAWNYIVGPGRVWQETGDSGYSRASFPVTLVERNQNCTHNGVATFLFSNSQAKSISNVRYQFTQETCLYFKFNMWGQASATYTRNSIKDADALKKAHIAEVANRLPTKSLSELAADFPGSKVNPQAFIQAFRAPEHITLYGLLVKGTNYVSKCPTRFGEYPFCDNLRLPSYSTAKSSLASLAMMRLGALFGSGVYRELIRNYVPEYFNGGDWTSVTFDNTLDMATGNFVNPGYLVDENGPQESTYIVDEPYPKKIADAFALFPHKAAPGTTWVYQSHATFIVTQAMNAYLQEKRDPKADIFELLRDDVFRPIRFSSGSLTTLRTDNTDKISKHAGKALGSHGLFYIVDDVAKLGKFLNNDGGKADATQILDPERLKESLFRNPEGLGLQISGVSGPFADTFRYQNAFWGKKMTHAEFPDRYRCDFWVARMGGYGGISIVLMPNGITYYVFSDNNEFPWYDAVHEANQLIPICKD